MAMTLKAARVNVGLSQEQAAKALGKSRTTLANWESGRTSPSMEMGKKIAELYKTSVDCLIFSAN